MQISRYMVCSTSYRPSRVECVLPTDSIGYTLCMAIFLVMVATI